jgi:hypothetical protein
VLNHRNLTVRGAQRILEKAQRIVELIPFSWDTKKIIPRSVDLEFDLT